jgi:CheY-like chemotaxis protein
MTDGVILIVEDDPVVRMAIKLRLEKLGYTVADITKSGEEAVQKTPILQPDLIQMDIILEGEMDSIDAAGFIKEQTNIPFV